MLYSQTVKNRKEIVFCNFLIENSGHVIFIVSYYAFFSIYYQIFSEKHVLTKLPVEKYQEQSIKWEVIFTYPCDFVFFDDIDEIIDCRIAPHALTEIKWRLNGCTLKS